MHENLWAGVGLKVDHAGFFLRQMQAALDRPREQRAALLEKAAAMANHASTRTTQLYDRRRDEVSLDEVERIAI